MNHDVNLSFRIPSALKAAMERAAKADNRTLSNWIRVQLEKAANL